MYCVLFQAENAKESRETEVTNIVLKSNKTSYKDLPRVSKRVHVIDNRENKNIRLITNGVSVVKKEEDGIPSCSNQIKH